MDGALEPNGVVSAMMSEHQKQTAFPRQCLLYDDTAERHKLEERITQLQHDEICVRHAVWLMALFAALAMAGLCYAAVFMADYPMNLSQPTGRLIIKVLCALGLGSLICLLVFLGLGVVYRKELDQRREEWRQLATKLLGVSPGQVPQHALACGGQRTGACEPWQGCRAGIGDLDAVQGVEESLILLGADHARQWPWDENNMEKHLVCIGKLKGNKYADKTLRFG